MRHIVIAAGALAMLAVLPAPALGGVTHISDRQELASCKYADAKGSGAKRRAYARGCRSAASVDREGFAKATTSVTYENPVYGSSFPDPGAMRDTPTDYYAYATGGGFPIIKSADMVHWQQIGQAFSSRPSWVVQSGDYHPWAPSVLRLPKSCPGTTSPGCYFMYYGGLSAQLTPATDCVGVAWSLTPSGPFTDLGPIEAQDGTKDLAGRPPGCGDAGGYGNIDAAPFVDSDGSVYLYLSTSRRCAQPTTQSCPYEPILSVLPMTGTPTRAKVSRKPLFGATPSSWEQEPGYPAQIEAPWMEKRGSTYYLFYSGGQYRAKYGMGYATASSPTGGTAYTAFAKSSLNPVLRETSQVLSPGGGSVTVGPNGGSWLVYHGRAGDHAQPRTLRIDPLYWSGTSVVTPGPTTGPQVVPPADTTPPQTTINSGPSGLTRSTSAQFTFSSSEAQSSFECKLDAGAFGACSSPKQYAGLSQGRHSLQVRATDAPGNTDPTPATRSWTVDTVAPQTTITSGPSGTTADDTPTFQFVSSQSPSTFSCRVDGATFAACSSPYTLSPLPPGAHTFDVRARDQAGNLDASPARRAFTVAASLISLASPLLDVEPPVVSLRGKRTQQAGRTVMVKMTATTEDVRVRASGSVTIRGWRRTYRLKGVKGRYVARGQRATLKLRLRRKTLLMVGKALGDDRGVRARLAIKARDGAGNSTVKKRAIRLRA